MSVCLLWRAGLAFKCVEAQGRDGIDEHLVCTMASPAHYCYRRTVEQLDAAPCHMSACHAPLTALCASLSHFTDTPRSKQDSADYFLLSRPSSRQPASACFGHWVPSVCICLCACVCVEEKPIFCYTRRSSFHTLLAFLTVIFHICSLFMSG